MKTKFLTVFTALLIVLGITKSTYAAAADKDNVTVLNDITRINKIEIHGNVELYISDGNDEQVKVYNKYYASSALVQSQNGVLRISSYSPEKLVVWVTVNDLRAISAYDNSEVRTFGKLSNIELDVELHNSSSAKLNLDAFSTNLTVTDRATADVTGNVNDFNVSHNFSSSVNSNNLAAVHYTDLTTGKNSPVNTLDLAGL